MIQYIYFVKCPNCEDEHFDFFDEAKEFALCCLGQQPIITQVEIDRNDFGECTDSRDLGTIWSWEDMIQDKPSVTNCSEFSKKDTFGCSDGDCCYDADRDPEFLNLDNSLDDIPDNFRRPVPAGMTVEQLVETMEENEDVVECKICEELFDKGDVHYEEGCGYVCTKCEAATGKVRDDSLCEQLKETVDFEYENLEITLTGNKRDVDDWDEVEHAGDYTYSVDRDEVATAIWENFLTEEDVADVPGGFDTLENDAEWQKFLDTHFDALLAKYYNQLLEYYRESAIESFQDTYTFADWEDEQYGNELDRRYQETQDSRYDDAFDNAFDLDF